MRRVPPEILDELDLPAAVEAEVAAWRNQLPPAPWVDALDAKQVDVAAWVHDRLSAEMPAVPNTTVKHERQPSGPGPSDTPDTPDTPATPATP